MLSSMIGKKHFSLTAFLLVIIFVIGSSALTLAAPAVKPEGSLVIALENLFEEGFLPERGNANQANFWEIVYDYLIYTDMKTRKLKPGLAKKWEFSKDYRNITLWLRDDVPWQDGWGNVSAEDVKFSIERVMLPSSASTHASSLRAEIASIELVDPYTLVIHLKAPDPVFLPYLTNTENAYMPIICKKYVEAVGNDKAMEQPVGSGPFRLVERMPGDYLKFEALEKHWRVVPEFKYITLKAVPEATTRLSMLRTGVVDATQIIPTQIDEVQKAGLGYKIWHGTYTTFMIFGGLIGPEDKGYIKGYHWQDPWVDQRVREAMSIAIDRVALAKTIYRGTGLPAACWIDAPSSEELKPIPYNPKRAKELLSSAGFPNGFSLTILSYPMTPGTEIPLLNTAIAGYWEQIGINVKIQTGTWEGVRPMVQNRKTAGIMRTHRSNPKEDYTSTLAIYINPGSSSLAFTTPESIALCNKLSKEVDDKKRDAIWKEVVEYWSKQDLLIPLVKGSTIWAHSNKIGEWPENSGVFPKNFVYIRHAKPLNTWRLFNP